MAVSDYSTTPADNTSISGRAVTDGTLADDLDNIIRQMMADTRAFYDEVLDTTSLAQSGYIIHQPSGLIEQWFLTSLIATGDTLAQSFPIAFPSAVYNVQATYVNLAATQSVGFNGVAQVRTLSLSQVTLANLSTATAQFYVVARGK